VLHKEIPFLRIGLPLCAGIISGLCFKPDLTFLVLISVIISTGFLISLFFNKYQINLIYGLSLTLAFWLCGLILYTFEKSSLSILKNEKTIFASTLCDYPEEKENTFMIRVNLVCKIEKERSEAVKGSMVLYHKKDSSVSSMIPGDLLIFRCTPVEILNRSNPYEFDYRFFMENQGIRYYAFTNSKDLIKHLTPPNRKLIPRALIIRQKIINMFRERGITGERLALVSAITLGQKSMLEPDQKLNFMKAGVMHIMAVSGLHAVILSLFVFSLLFFMKRRFKIARIIITILILWIFAFVTGLTPSVLRATLMFSFLQAGKMMKRPVNGINSVLASAFVLIIIRPSVIFDAGFLLSYSAVIYIISFYYGFYQMAQLKNWLADKIWQSAAITIVAQAGTLPLTILLFNRFPVYFILANITIVPVSNLLIITGCLVPIFFHIRFLSHFLAVLLNQITGLTEFMTSIVASLPNSSIENIGMNTTECILLTCSIFLLGYWLLNRKSFAVIYPVIFLLLFVMTGMIKDISSKKTNELIIYNTPGSTTIGLKTGKTLNLYADTTFIRPEVSRHCSVLGLKIKTTVLNNTYQCLQTGNKKILITRVLSSLIIRNYNPDIVILTGNRPVIENNLSLLHPPRLIIVSSEATSGFHFPQQSVLSGIDSIHFVRKSGAFIKRI
jgi:competence protein ComEC